MQIASHASRQEAEQQVAGLVAQGVDAYSVEADVPGVGTRYRVRVGRFASKAEAQKNGEYLRRQRVTGEFFVTAYLAPAETTAPTSSAAATTVPPGSATETTSAAAPVAAEATTAAKSDFRTFRDPAVGYSFARPALWEGGAWSVAHSRVQGADAGASFASKRDRASLRAVWTRLPDANDTRMYDADAIVAEAIKRIAPVASVQELRELSRAAETAGKDIETHLELEMVARDPSSAGTVSFLCKAVIVRCARGVLVLAVFYPADAPTSFAVSADLIVRSVRAPG